MLKVYQKLVTFLARVVIQITVATVSTGYIKGVVELRVTERKFLV